MRVHYWLDWQDRDARKPFRSQAGKEEIAQSHDGVVFTEDQYIEVVAFRGASLDII